MVRTVKMNPPCQSDVVPANGPTLMTLGSGFWTASGGEGKESRGHLFCFWLMLPDCRCVAGPALPHCVLRAGSPTPPLSGSALLCCSGELHAWLSQLLGLVRDRANSPLVMTLGLVLTTATGGEGHISVSMRVCACLMACLCACLCVCV